MKWEKNLGRVLTTEQLPQEKRKTTVILRRVERHWTFELWVDFLYSAYSSQVKVHMSWIYFNLWNFDTLITRQIFSCTCFTVRLWFSSHEDLQFLHSLRCCAFDLEMTGTSFSFGVSQLISIYIQIGSLILTTAWYFLYVT